MLGTLLIALAVAGPDLSGAQREAEKAQALNDHFIEVRSVELPGEGLDPRRMTLVIKQAVTGCRQAGQPIIERKNTIIRILPQSEPASGRCPSATAVRETTQIVQLGRLERGTYRVRVVTEKSRVNKILNIY